MSQDARPPSDVKEVGDTSRAIGEPSFFSLRQIAELKTRFGNIRVASANCHATDEEPLHAVIRTGFTSLADFDRICSCAFLAALELSIQADALHVERELRADIAAQRQPWRLNDSPVLKRFSDGVDELKKKIGSGAATAMRLGRGSSSDSSAPAQA